MSLVAVDNWISARPVGSCGQNGSACHAVRDEAPERPRRKWDDARRDLRRGARHPRHTRRACHPTTVHPVLRSQRNPPVRLPGQYSTISLPAPRVLRTRSSSSPPPLQPKQPRSHPSLLYAREVSLSSGGLDLRLPKARTDLRVESSSSTRSFHRSARRCGGVAISHSVCSHDWNYFGAQGRTVARRRTLVGRA